MFITLVVIDSTKSLPDENNLQKLEDSIPKFPGSDFQKHVSDCENHSLLTIQQLKAAKKMMYSYIVLVSKALERRFPDMEFIIANTDFLDPSMRKLQQPNRAGFA